MMFIRTIGWSGRDRSHWPRADGVAGRAVNAQVGPVDPPPRRRTRTGGLAGGCRHRRRRRRSGKRSKRWSRSSRPTGSSAISNSGRRPRCSRIFANTGSRICTTARSTTCRTCNSSRRKATRPRPIPPTARSPTANRINRRTATRSERSPTRNSTTTSPAGPRTRPGTQRRRPSATLTPRKSSAGTTASGSTKSGAARPAPAAGVTPAPSRKKDAGLRPCSNLLGIFRVADDVVASNLLDRGR